MPPGADVVASGGGARHPVLYRLARRRPRGCRVAGSARFDELFFNGDAKEAVAFALLGYLTLHGQPANLPSCTGARGARVLGKHHARMTASRLIFPAIRWRDAEGFAHEWGPIREALELGVGGFIIFGGTAEAVSALTTQLRREAGQPLLLAADLERGAGQQFDGLTQFPPPRALAALDRLEVTRWAGAVTAHEARGVGVNWVFAPVADLDLLPDNPIIQTRAFGAEPEARGAARGGVDRGMPVHRRARVCQALSRSCPHDRGFPHRPCRWWRPRATSSRSTRCPSARPSMPASPRS